MAESVPDQAQRRQALDHSRSFIVQAPAGSGKTELLVQRFLTLLARVDRPEAIVAITFTRKAAAEMRQRVIEALRRASGTEPGTPHARYTWALAGNAVSQDARLGWCLEEHPARLRIQTIDSLCAMLVRHMPLVSRMGAILLPSERPGHLYRMAARRTAAILDAAGRPSETRQALARLLAHLDNNVATFERLVAGMLGKRDQWLRYVGADGASSAARAGLETALGRIVIPALERVEAAFPRQYRSETVWLARCAAKNLRRDDPGHPLTACFELADFPDATLGSLRAWLGIAAMFVTERGAPLRRIDKRRGFPAGTADRRAAKLRWEQVALPAGVIAQLAEVRELPPTRFGDMQWDVLSALMHLLPVAVDQLGQVFREEGSVDFAEIAIAARRATEPGPAATQAGMLDPAIQHVLIDEFQDTSQTQFDLLTRLVRDWQPGDGRTVFAVGDPMQSIYGFREAEVGLFLRARRAGMGPVRLEPLSLTTNFRSTATVVQWVNGALSKAFPESEDILTGAVTYEHSVAFKGADAAGGVRVHPFFSADPQPEARRVVEVIEEVRSRRPGGTIAVLVLARTHLPGIVAALREAGTSFRAVEIDALGERAVVRDLMSLTLALAHPGDRVAWLSVLRAPWCGLSLADLEALVGGDTEVALWDQLQDPACQERLSSDGRTRIRRLLPVLRDALKLRGRLSIRRWVESTWIALGGPACLEDVNELADAEAFLDLLERSAEGAELGDERQFADDVASLFASGDDAADDSLQLMTIHKAKGLEFDAVILPGLGRRPRSPENPLLLWREFMDEEKARLVLAPIKETGGVDDAIYKYLKRIERVRRHNESTRLLYVAATRARRDLHLLGHVEIKRGEHEIRKPPAGLLLSQIWKTAEPVFKEALEADTSEAEGASSGEPGPPGVPIRRIEADWSPGEPPHDAAWEARTGALDVDDPDEPVKYDWATDLQRRVGLVVHRMLQNLQAPDKLAFSEETLRAALRCEGLDGSELDKAAARAREALGNTIADKRGRWILSRHERDEREYALSTFVDGSIRRIVLDRTFVHEGKRWIIDYKTGTHAGGNPGGFLDDEQRRYRSQLEKYARALQNLDSRPIHLGLYFPMLQGWREWQFVAR